MNKTIVLTVVVIVLVVLGVFAYTWYNKPAPAHNTGVVAASSSNQSQVATTSSAAAGETTNTTAAATSKPPINSIILADLDTGIMTTVREVSLTKPSYVVLYVIDSNGAVKSIGHSDLLSVGLHTNVMIQTDNVVAYKQAVIAVVHQDNGDGVFGSLSSDKYAVNSNGSLVSDIDVVGVQGVSDEAKALQSRVETYLEKLKADASSSASL